MAEKRYLFTPGPTPVPPEVLAALAEPVVHHRGARLPDALRRVPRPPAGRLSAPPATCSSSPPPGTGAMESAVANLCSPGDRVVVVSAGALRRALARRSRRPTAATSRPSSTSGARRRARTTCAAQLDELGGAKAVFLTHSETSTGVVADVQALAAAAKPSGALVVVDAVSSLGAVPLETDAWGLDVVASGSQKALMTPPGLGARLGLGAPSGSAAAARRRASTSTGSGRAPARRSSTAPFTPAVSLVRGARRRARAAARRGARGRVRPPRPPRPCLPRGRQGDGARALLARRGPLRRRHRRPHARRASTRASCVSPSATGTASRSPAATAT